MWNLMKKAEVSTRAISLPGKRIVVYEWKFTATEKKEIRNTLENETSKNEDIETFIRHLEFFCHGKKYLLEQPQRIDVREERETILKHCKAALKHLRKVERGQVQTWYTETLDSFGSGKDDPDADFIVRGLQSAWDAVGPLENFVKLFEKYHQSEIKKDGRKPADNDHFIRKIRDVYIEHIGKPTESGAFFTIVTRILEMLDLPFTDPSRAIKAALKSK